MPNGPACSPAAKWRSSSGVRTSPPGRVRRDGAAPAGVQQAQDHLAHDQPAALPAVLGERRQLGVDVQVGAPARGLQAGTEGPLDRPVGGRRRHQHRLREVLRPARRGQQRDAAAEVLLERRRQAGIRPGPRPAVGPRDDRLADPVAGSVPGGAPAQQPGHPAGGQRLGGGAGLRWQGDRVTAVAGEAVDVGGDGLVRRAPGHGLDRPGGQAGHPADGGHATAADAARSSSRRSAVVDDLADGSC